MAELWLSSVLEVFGRRPDEAVVAYGSGYLIGPSAVLTAAHIVRGSRSQQVRRSGDASVVEARLVWEDESLDVALLALSEPYDDVQLTPMTAIHSGAAQQLVFRAAGFPRFGQVGELRDSKQIAGNVYIGSNQKQGGLDVQITSHTPVGSLVDPWQGISGSSIINDEFGVVGLISRRVLPSGHSALEGVSISSVAQSEGFVDALRQLGVDPPVHREIQSLARKSILSRAEFLQSLPALRRSLLREDVTYVSPGESHAAAPARILETLVAESGKRAVLLTGAGGVGKTRTCLEVMELAEQSGWTTLYVQPVDGNFDNEDLIRAVAGISGTVLVCLDYINELPNVELGNLVGGLSPHDLNRVHVLASARPGWVATHRRKLAATVRVIEIERSTEFQQEILSTNLQSLAPTAIAVLGAAEVSRLCGRRPMIALLIATEVERVILEHGELATTKAPPSGDLLLWLTRRLQEDQLQREDPGSVWAPDTMPQHLVECASILMCTPQSETSIQQFLNILADANPEIGYSHSWFVLKELGWIEAYEGQMSSVHDIVVDLLLDNLLRDSFGRVTEAEGLERVMDPLLNDARSLWRAMTHINRYALDLVEDQDVSDLRALLSNWFGIHASAVGEAFSSDLSVGGYALGGMLRDESIEGIFDGAISAVATPWLSKFGDEPEARHVLYGWLAVADSTSWTVIERHARAWIDIHGRSLHASYVLTAVLRSPHLSAPDHRVWLDAGLAYLRIHQVHPASQFVLAQIMNRRDVDPPVLAEVYSLALVWLAANRIQPAEFPLRACLERKDNDGQVGEILQHALGWLDAYGDHASASFLLEVILRRSDLDIPTLAGAVAQSAAWLEHFSDLEGAQFVLNSLLLREDLAESSRRDIVRRADSWLDLFRDHETASFVYGPLLLSYVRLELDTESLLANATAWFRVHAETTGSMRLVQALIQLGIEYLDQVFSGDEFDWWLVSQVDSPEFSFVSKTALMSESPSEGVIFSALLWCSRNIDDTDFSWRMFGVLRHIGRYERYKDMAISLIETFMWHARASLATRHDEIDPLICTMCSAFRTGIVAARADDVLVEWIATPNSISAPAGPRAQSITLISRIVALRLAKRLEHLSTEALLLKLDPFIRSWTDREAAGVAQLLLDPWRAELAHTADVASE